MRHQAASRPPPLQGPWVHTFQTWRDSINGSPNEGAVVRVVQEYVSALAGLVAELPQECQQTLSGGKDMNVQAAAVVLLQVELAYRGTAENIQLLHEVVLTFAAASVRLSQLRTQATAASPNLMWGEPSDEKP
jgi:hypothetical protein